MTGLESITKKILEAAENKANAIIENAKSRAKEIAEAPGGTLPRKRAVGAGGPAKRGAKGPAYYSRRPA